MLKANKRYTNSLQPCTVLNISVTINIEHIRDTIILMLERNDKITKTSVEKELRDYLFMDGFSFNQYLNERIDEDLYNDFYNKANILANKLFPDFKTIK